MTVPYVYVEAARFLLACFAVGSVLGFITALIRGERNG